MNRTIALLSLLLVWVAGGFAQQRTDSVHVAHYDLHLSVVDFTNHVIDGYTDLTVVSKINNFNQLRLDLKYLSCDSVFVGSTAVTFSQSGENIYINLPLMQSGDTASVRVYYHGTPGHDDGFGGFYYSGQYAYIVGVALHDQPHAYGRCWFPCMDEFTDKSSYNFHIRTQNGKMAVCNGLLTDSLTLDDGTRIWDWYLDNPIPTYLASMAVGNYRCYADTFQGMNGVIPIEIYTSPAIYPNIPGSFANLKPVLHKFEEFFGPYVWPRVGYVCVAMTGGAMEHATNIALPNVAVTGGLMYEGTIMHELFHHWFGDLITCERPEEMWINEGFANYSESLVKEWLYDNYWENIKEEHTNTLQNLVKQDDGLYALDNVPQEYTYGMHSYQKGGLVIHTLRNYMGDSLFFNSLRQLLAHYAYQNINSEEFFTFLTQVSGMNLMNFYEDWIHQPGFLDFDVEKIVGHDNGSYSVFVRQSGYGTTHLGTDVPVDITFVSDDREFYTFENQLISGEMTEVTLQPPFVPAFVILDYRGKLSDATIDDTKKVADAGTVSFSETSCNAQISHISDTALLYVAHHYVAPTTPTPLPEGYHRFSNTHYWTVRYAGAMPEGSWKFRLIRASGQPDFDFFSNGDTFENLKLMYRPDGQSNWIPVPYTYTGSPYNALISTSDMKSGEYCFALADESVSVNESCTGVRLGIYPNPATQSFMLTTDASKADKAIVFDSLGRKVKTWRISSDSQLVDVNNLPAGNYIVVLYHKGKSVARTMFMKR
jgi:aminopeptidase N